MAAPMTLFRLRMFGTQFLQQNNWMSVAVQSRLGFCIHRSMKFNLCIDSGQQFPKTSGLLSNAKANCLVGVFSEAKNMCTKPNSKPAAHCDRFRQDFSSSSSCGPYGAFNTFTIPHVLCRFATHHCVCRNYSSANKPKVKHVKEIPETNHKESDVASSKQNLKENIRTVPNLLTTLRLLSAPVIGYLVIHDNLTWALGLFVCAGLTDVLDGYIARNFKNQMSALGTIIDPLADKVLMFTLAVTLAAAQLLPVPLAAVIIGRDVILVAAGFIVRYRSLPPPRTISSYFDITKPTTEVHPSTLSKINTGLQIMLISATLASPVFDFVDHPALQIMWWITGATTIASGVGYAMFWKSAVTFLDKGKKR